MYALEYQPSRRVIEPQALVDSLKALKNITFSRRLTSYVRVCVFMRMFKAIEMHRSVLLRECRFLNLKFAPFILIGLNKQIAAFGA